MRHQVVKAEALKVEAEALRVEAEAIQKLPFPHPWYLPKRKWIKTSTKPFGKFSSANAAWLIDKPSATTAPS